MSTSKIAEKLQKDMPNGWNITTTTTYHISIIYDTGKNIVLNKHKDGWTVMGLSGFNTEDYPRFARKVGQPQAVTIAINAMEKISNDNLESVNVVAYASDINTESNTDTTSDNKEPPHDQPTRQSSSTAETINSEGEDADNQTSLTEF
jgi:hypothetical protein